MSLPFSPLSPSCYSLHSLSLLFLFLLLLLSCPFILYSSGLSSLSLIVSLFLLLFSSLFLSPPLLLPLRPLTLLSTRWRTLLRLTRESGATTYRPLLRISNSPHPLRHSSRVSCLCQMQITLLM